MASSSATISLLLCTLFFTINPISSFLVHDICEQTKNPNFCYNVFYHDASADLQGLAKSVIDQTLEQATFTRSIIQSLLSQTNDPKQKEVYILCSNTYSDALNSLAAASQKLKSGDFRDVKTEADAVSTDTALCRKAFSTAASQPVSVASDINVLELFANVFVVVSGKF